MVESLQDNTAIVIWCFVWEVHDWVGHMHSAGADL